MLDFVKIVNELYEHPNNLIYFDQLKSQIISFSESEMIEVIEKKKSVKEIEDVLNDKNGIRYVPLFSFDIKELKEIAKDYVTYNKEEYVDFDFNQKISIPAFKKYNNEHNLHHRWMQYFDERMAYRIASWAFDEGVSELEADEETYSLIRKELEIYEENKYEKMFSDKQIIIVNDKGFKFIFTVLGNANISYGLNIFPSDNSETMFGSFYTINKTFMDKGTFLSLSQVLSFYIEKEDNIDLNDYRLQIKNPLGDDDRYSSIQIYPGLQANNYLTKSMGLYSLKVLRYINHVLKRIVNHENFEDIDTEVFQRVVYDESFSSVWPYSVHRIEEEDLEPEGFFYQAEKDEINIPEKLKFVKKPWAFSIRRFRNHFLDDSDNRIIRFIFMAFFVDQDGEVLHYIATNNKPYGRPMELLSDAIYKQISNKQMSSTLVVNNFFDFVMANLIFNPYIQNHDMEIQLDYQELAVDEVYDDFCSQFEDFPGNPDDA